VTSENKILQIGRTLISTSVSVSSPVKETKSDIKITNNDSKPNEGIDFSDNYLNFDLKPGMDDFKNDFDNNNI